MLLAPLRWPDGGGPATVMAPLPPLSAISAGWV